MNFVTEGHLYHCDWPRRLEELALLKFGMYVAVCIGMLGVFSEKLAALEPLQDRFAPPAEDDLTQGNSTSVFTVTDVGDTGPGSLRYAITRSNATPGIDRIEFKIGSGLQTIKPLSALPEITDPVVIDGTTQHGFVGRPLIELDGSLVDGCGADFGVTSTRRVGECDAALYISAGGSTVRGLVINSFSGDGIKLSDRGNNRILGNYIGTEATGTLRRGNKLNGIFILDSAANQIGGTKAGERNILSGNGLYGVTIAGAKSRNNKVVGNFIGTDVTGAAKMGNSRSGVLVFNAPSNTIGGEGTGAGNVISGNARTGITLDGAATRPGGGPPGGRGDTRHNAIQGNFIGTDASGTRPLGNGLNGVMVFMGQFNTIGGTVAGMQNVISSNKKNAIVILGPNPKGPDWRRYARKPGGGLVLNPYASDDLFASGHMDVTGNIVAGNLIGTDVTGTAKLGNGGFGVMIAHSPRNMIGGLTSGAGNVISGNVKHGVNIVGPTSSGNKVYGNMIGTDIKGIGPLGNGLNGVRITGGSANEIGGNGPRKRNIIAFNAQKDVLVVGTGNNNRILNSSVPRIREID